MNFPQRQNIQRQTNSQLIIVGSKNPVKIGAAEQAFTQAMPQERWLAQGLDVPSGVSEQPMTDAETLQGAMTRMQNAQKLFPGADYWVGIEGGIDRQGSEMHAFAWSSGQRWTESGQSPYGYLCPTTGDHGLDRSRGRAGRGR